MKQSLLLQALLALAAFALPACGHDPSDALFDNGIGGAAGHDGGTTTGGSAGTGGNDGGMECAPGSVLCSGQCTDTKNDSKNCSACGNACAKGYVCLNGSCSCTGSKCGGVCVDTKNDPANCGSCGNRCRGSCNGGMCAGCTAVSDLYVLQDVSGSMSEAFAEAPSKYDACKTAVMNFLDEPAEQKVGVGLGFWPLTTQTVPPTCTTNEDCGSGGLCLGNMCVNASQDSCVASDFEKPAVAIAPAPSVSSSFASAYATKSPDGTSCPPPGLTGALTYLKSFASAHAGHKVGLILIADGEPSECGGKTMADLMPIAQEFATGTPPIPTFVIGLPNMMPVPKDKFDSLATAGGTSSSYMPTTPSDLSTALRAINTAFKACP
jgi:hypothetical protein